MILLRITLMLIVVHLIELKINPGLFSFRNHLGHGLTMSIVGRCKRSDLRHGTLNEIRHVGGRCKRSDLRHGTPNEIRHVGGRSERSDLRHGTLNEIRHVGGRSARSDLQYSLFTITCVK